MLARSRADNPQPDTSDPFAVPRTFTPFCLIPRAQLPLAYLDTSQYGTRLFSAHISALEASHELGGNCILVAEEAKEKRLYAIERAQRRTYALCRLGNWVKEEALEESAVSTIRAGEPLVKRQALDAAASAGPWWMIAAVPLPEASEQPKSRRNDTPLLDMRPLKPPQDAGNLSKEANVTPAGELPAHDFAPGGELPIAPQSVEEVLQDLSKHYLQALYLSRTSLAYFTKGSLSRARAAFTTTAESGGFETSELVTFLRDSILTVNVADKKYRDGLAAIVQDTPAVEPRPPEQPPKAKKKRKRKAKRDKGGFFSDEKDYVEQWWREYDDDGGVPNSGETVDAGFKRRSPRLRNRETYLQIILALEVLALEASLPPQPAPEANAISESQIAETQGDEIQEVAATKRPRSKKPIDLPALLDTLVDRLSIWHSLESASPVKKGDDHGDSKDAGSDELRNFCTEVIIPFYVSRVPQHAIVVNKKLGGPSAPTPTKRKEKSARKPGEPASRQPSQPEKKPRKPLSRIASDAHLSACKLSRGLQAPEKKPRGPLSRVASEAQRPTSQAIPGLARSATDSDALFTHIKREQSQTPGPELSSIPAVKTSQPRKRVNALDSLTGNFRREIDVDHVAKTTEAKARKKAEMDSKLAEAIEGLKKPNRSLATREIAENADLRFSKATAGKARPTLGGRKKTTDGGGPKAAAGGVHVMATPSHKRSVKATPAGVKYGGLHSSGTTHVSGTTARPRAERDMGAFEEAEPPVSTFAVPQTGHRPRQTNYDDTLEGGGVAETPSRGFARFMPRGLAREPGTLDSPVASRGIVESPSSRRQAQYQLPHDESTSARVGVVDSPTATRRIPAASAAAIASTPVKPVRSLSLVPPAPATLVEASPNVEKVAPLELSKDTRSGGEQGGGGDRGVGAEKSIYDTLGWDEEYEELT